MGVCCVIKQPLDHSNQIIKNQSPNLFNKQNIMFFATTENDSKFSYFLYAFQIESLLNQFLSEICQADDRKKWILQNRLKLQQYIQNAKTYISELNDQNSKIINQLQKDQQHLSKWSNQQTYNKQKKKQQNPELNLKTYQQFYLIKLQIQHIKCLDRITKLGISIFNSQDTQQFKLQNEQKQEHLIQTSNLKLGNKPFYVEFAVKSSSMIRFTTYPIQSKFTLRADEFLKYSYLSEKIQLKKISYQHQKIKQTSNIVNNASFSKNQEIYGIFTVRIQIVKFQQKKNLDSLRLNTKNLIHQMQMVLNDQNGWQHVNSLRSSFVTTENNSSMNSGYC